MSCPPPTPELPPRRFGTALAELRSKQKTSKGAPAYSLLVNRRLGRVLAAAAYVLGATPNMVTLVSAAFTLSAVAVIALTAPTVVMSIAVCLLLVIGYALDAADGQLARLRGGGSIAGEWLDHLVDATKVATLHAAVLINWYRFGDRPAVALLVPLAYQAIASILFFLMILNDQLRRAQRNSTEMLLQKDGSSSFLYSLAVVPTDYGLLCCSFALMWWTNGFTWIYTALMVCNAAFLAVATMKWFREVSTFR